MRRHISLLVFTLLIGACGRYGKPLYPELLAPDNVRNLTVVGVNEGVKFDWRAPLNDQRGKDLKSIEGYRIYRKPIVKPSDAVDPEVPFEVVTLVSDTHLEELDKARQALRKQGRVGRRAKIDPKLYDFEYVDAGLQAGKTYLYKVIPINQGGVESSAFQLVKVLWRGATSEVTEVDRRALVAEEEDSDSM